MQCKVLGGSLAEDLLADWAHPQTMAGISDTDMPEGLSQELSAENDVRTQSFRETRNKVFYHRSVVMNLDRGGLRVGWLLLFQLLDLSPDLLVAGERLLEGTPLQASLLDRPHDALRLLAELGELTTASRSLRWFGLARWSAVRGEAQSLDVFG